MSSQPITTYTRTRRSRAWLIVYLVGVLLLAACRTPIGSEPLPTVMDVAVVPTEEPTLPPTATLPPTSTPPTPATVTATFTPLPTSEDAAATPSPEPLTTGTIPPTNIISTPIVFPTNTRFIPTNTPRVPTNTPTPLVTFTFTPSPTPLATNTPIVTNTPTPNPATWRGDYFNNRDLSGSPTFSREDSSLAFNWGDGSPASNFPSDNFSARWTRTVQFAPATYRFYVRADDGVRIWLDNDQIINEWHDATSQTYSVERTVAAGNHTIKVEYYENIGTAQIQVWWEQSGQFPQWRGEYFSNASLSGPVVLLRNDADINFNWANGSPDSSMPNDNFSARWTRTLSFNNGRYRFNATVDDGIRIYLDGVLIMDDWRDAGERTISVERQVTNANHLVQIEYYDRTGEARIRVWWELIDGGGQYPDWRGEYFTNENLSGNPALTRNDTSVDFNWGTNSPANGIPANYFSVRWTRTINFEAGTYRFRAQANDGIRVYVDGNRIIDEWHLSAGSVVYEAQITLTGGSHTVVVEYYEQENNALAKMWYERIGN